MNMFARIEHSVVAELFATAEDISTLFHAQLRWVDVTGRHVEVGWGYAGGVFTPPQPPIVVPPSMPTLAVLQAQLAQIAAQVATLQSQSKT